jgi:hypothetical protein
MALPKSLGKGHLLDFSLVAHRETRHRGTDCSQGRFGVIGFTTAGTGRPRTALVAMRKPCSSAGNLGDEDIGGWPHLEHEISQLVAPSDDALLVPLVWPARDDPRVHVQRASASSGRALSEARSWSERPVALGWLDGRDEVPTVAWKDDGGAGFGPTSSYVETYWLLIPWG